MASLNYLALRIYCTSWRRHIGAEHIVWQRLLDNLKANDFPYEVRFLQLMPSTSMSRANSLNAKRRIEDLGRTECVLVSCHAPLDDAKRGST